MTQPTERSVLKKLLDHYDQLGTLRAKLAGDDIDTAETRRLQAQTRRKIELIGKDLRQLPERSALGELNKRYKLNKHQFVFLLSLLRRRLTSDNPYLKGRELLGLVFDSSFDILRGSTFLEPTSTLLSAGLIAPDARDDEDEDELLETPFKLSDRVFRLVRNTFLSQRSIQFPGTKTRVQPYRSNLGYVLDMRRLTLLFRKRAAKIFQFDYWDDIGLGTAESVTALNQQIRRFRQRMALALKKTEKADTFPMATLQKEFSLGEPEMIILITLLFQELMEGGAFLDAVDLIKLISGSEEELIQKRQFLSKRSILVKNNLVAIEEMVHDKELTAEVYLPNWVVDRLLGKGGRQSIDADVRLDFHDYLSNLGSSEDFFEDLDAGE